MKIGVISDGPMLTTGYGLPTRHLCQRFHQRGNEVVCLGVHQEINYKRPEALPYRVWATCRHDPNSLELLGPFLHHEEPDVLLLFNTLKVCSDWVRLIRNKHDCTIPIVAYFTAEGAPLSQDWASTFLHIQGAAAATRFTQQSALDAYRVEAESVYLGLDHGTFSAIDRDLRRKLRRAVGWDDRFMVMFVGRNMFTKQQDKVVEAASLIKSEGINDVLIYMHCRMYDIAAGSWNLDQLARQYDVRDMLRFPPDLLDQKRGIPHGQDLADWVPGDDHETNLASLSLAARYNCADLYIHPSMVEGFSFPCVEAMASGLPIAHTDDDGVMNEVCGKAGYRIPSVAEFTAPWGSRYKILSARDIADAILRLRDRIRTSTEEREALVGLSIEQASRYDWDKTAASLLHLLDNAAAR